MGRIDLAKNNFEIFLGSYVPIPESIGKWVAHKITKK